MAYFLKKSKLKKGLYLQIYESLRKIGFPQEVKREQSAIDAATPYHGKNLHKNAREMRCFTPFASIIDYFTNVSDKGARIRA